MPCPSSSGIVLSHLPTEACGCTESLGGVKDRRWKTSIFFYRRMTRELLGVALHERSGLYFSFVRAGCLILQADIVLREVRLVFQADAALREARLVIQVGIELPPVAACHEWELLLLTIVGQWAGPGPARPGNDSAWPN